HVGLKEKDVVVSLCRAKLGCELSALPVGNLAVVERDFNQHRRIILRLDVVVRRVGNHIVERSLLVWIAPLYVLACGQREACIQHRVDDINEGDLRYGGLEEIRSHVDDSAHEHPASASTLNDKAVA